MARSQESGDQTAERLRALTACLAAHLSEAESLRLRILKAQEANRWPDFRTLALLPKRADVYRP
jgi:hypothetical protein